MLKEIHEQGAVLRNTLAGRIDEHSDSVRLTDMNIAPEELKACGKIFIVACGTAWHAGMVGKFLIEKFAKVPVELDLASEFRYRDPIIPPKQHHDPRVAVRRDRRHPGGHPHRQEPRRPRSRPTSTPSGPPWPRVHGVSTIRPAHRDRSRLHQGLHSQCMCSRPVHIWLGQVRGTLDKDQVARMIRELRAVPDKVESPS
jgi:glucosamine--fructose-6-phosphate aminotransferase (isomerizing)